VIHRSIGLVAATWLAFAALPVHLVAQGEHLPAQSERSAGPFARIAVMRALDGHGVEWEAGYVRHLE